MAMRLKMQLFAVPLLNSGGQPSRSHILLLQAMHLHPRVLNNYDGCVCCTDCTDTAALTMHALNTLYRVVPAAGGGLIRQLDVERQLEALPLSNEQWPLWMSEMFDHAEMVEQVGVRCLTIRTTA